MTLADLIGVLRALATLPIAAAIAAEADLVAVGVFGAAAATDALDGWVARRTRTTTPHGAVLDPLADKVLVLGTAYALALAGRLDPVLVGAIAGRELFVAALRLTAHARGFAIATSRVAKAKTALEMAGLALVVALPGTVSTIGELMLVVALAIGVLTIPHYLPRSMRRLT